MNWLIGIFLVCVFLYILYSAWRMYLRIQYYTTQNKSAMEEEKKEASSVCNKHNNSVGVGEEKRAVPPRSSGSTHTTTASLPSASPPSEPTSSYPSFTHHPVHFNCPFIILPLCQHLPVQIPRLCVHLLLLMSPFQHALRLRGSCGNGQIHLRQKQVGVEVIGVVLVDAVCERQRLRRGSVLVLRSFYINESITARALALGKCTQKNNP